ncbi:uncharacterized protein LOC134763093 [Penaeus indicus]|uniref:uncharacterized protein LOC134763093 n=1 Tax=Penaeus indicus TaxID=29960 RepID=UPI00300D2267
MPHEPEITVSEIQQALRKLSMNKSPGVDDIPAELAKAKGDNKDCKNYRTISLTPHASKVLLHFINQRMESYAAREIPTEQAGFAKGKGTKDHIASLRHIIEKARAYIRTRQPEFARYMVIQTVFTSDKERLVNNLRYADDTTVITDNLTDMETILERMRLEDVDSFNYLGAFVNRVGGCEKEIRSRIGQAKSGMTRLTTVWKNHHVSKMSKIRLVQAIIFPIATYACENWALTVADERRIQAFEMWCWRRLLRVPWTAHRTNESIINEIGVNTTLLGRIANRMLKYFGHIMRREGDNLEKIILQGKIEGKRGRGRQKRRYADSIKALSGCGRMVGAMRLVENCVEWRSVAFAESARRLR